jgi:DNA-binding beta-propeller fold protein YncE
MGLRRRALRAAIPLAAAIGFVLVALPASAGQSLKPLLQFGTTGSDPGQFNGPTRLAALPDGTLLVEDNFNDRINVFKPNGHFKRLIGSSGAGAGQLDDPFGTSLAPDGKLYVAEQANNRISEFTTGGSFIRAWGVDVLEGPPSGFGVCTTTTGC